VNVPGIQSAQSTEPWRLGTQKAETLRKRCAYLWSPFEDELWKRLAFLRL